jgi:hypothetical protein
MMHCVDVRRTCLPTLMSDAQHSYAVCRCAQALRQATLEEILSSGGTSVGAFEITYILLRLVLVQSVLMILQIDGQLL